MSAETVLNLVGLFFLVASGVILAYSPNPLLDAVVKGLAPSVINIGRTPDQSFLTERAGQVTAGAVQSRKRVRIGCAVLIVGALLQIAALLVHSGLL